MIDWKSRPKVGPVETATLNCPNCQHEVGQKTWRHLRRQGQKNVWVHLDCWSCANCRLRFVTPQMESGNDQKIDEAWQEKYGEPAPIPVGQKINRLMRTPEGKKVVGRAFGQLLEKRIKENERHHD